MMAFQGQPHSPCPAELPAVGPSWLRPSWLHQWQLVCGLDPAPMDEPTSLGTSALGTLRRTIVPSHLSKAPIEGGCERGHST